MERVNRILTHPVFRQKLTELEALEREREFCRHGLDHLLAVARLMLIYNGEEGAGIPREILYAAALLHDIGRGSQYTAGIPHEQAGVEIAAPILADCGFDGEESRRILAAIGSHRENESRSELGRLLYQADKKSRACFACPVSAACNWPEEKKNHTLEC